MTKGKELTTHGCLSKAKDDEMLFILRAQDYSAPLVVLEWIKHNFSTCPEDKLREAFECAMEMKKHKHTKAAD